MFVVTHMSLASVDPGDITAEAENNLILQPLNGHSVHLDSYKNYWPQWPTTTLGHWLILNKRQATQHPPSTCSNTF